MAYNLYQLNDSRVSERKALTISLYKEISQNQDVEIREAAPREALRVFGGSKSIKKFRKNSQSFLKEFLVFLPPIIPQIPIIVEDFNDKVEHIDLLEKKKYKLARTKPLPNKNSLVQSIKFKTKNND